MIDFLRPGFRLESGLLCQRHAPVRFSSLFELPLLLCQMLTSIGFIIWATSHAMFFAEALNTQISSSAIPMVNTGRR